jgi:hypothetical protein
MRAIIGSLWRTAQQRDTLYGPAPAERQQAAAAASALLPVIQTLPGDPRALANAVG